MEPLEVISFVSSSLKMKNEPLGQEHWNSWSGRLATRLMIPSRILSIAFFCKMRRSLVSFLAQLNIWVKSNVFSKLHTEKKQSGNSHFCGKRITRRVLAYSFSARFPIEFERAYGFVCQTCNENMKQTKEDGITWIGSKRGPITTSNLFVNEEMQNNWDLVLFFTYHII